MTLLQAMERTDWSLRFAGVLTASGLLGVKRFICEVCDNEFGDLYFAVFRDDRGKESYYVDVGGKCASDLETAYEMQERRRRARQ